MELATRIGILSASPSNNLNTPNQKFDRFTNANQNGVMLSKVDGTARFQQIVLPASVWSGIGGANYATIKAITDGSYTINHGGTPYSSTSLNINTNGSITDMDTFAAYIQGELQTDTSDTTISVVYEDGKFTVASEEEDIFFVDNGTGTDLGASMALVGDYSPVVTPLREVEGYTPLDNDPQSLHMWYRFESSLVDTKGNGGAFSAILGDPPAYTSFGSPSLAFVYTSTTGTALAADVSEDIAPGDFDFGFMFRMDDLPAAASTAEFLVWANSTYTDSYFRAKLSDAGAFTVEVENPANGADTVTLDGGTLATDTTYIARVKYVSSTGAISLYVNVLDTPVDSATFSSPPDFSTVEVFAVALGTDTLTGNPGIDGFVGQIGFFNDIEPDAYWLDVYNSGAVRPFQYSYDGIMVCTFRDIPQTITSVLVEVLTPYYEESESGVLLYNMYDGAVSITPESRIPGQIVPVVGGTKEDIQTCILTLNIDPTKGYALVSGISVTFFE